MMRKTFMMMGAAALLLVYAPGMAGAASVDGTWRTPKGWLIKIAPCGDARCGTVVGGTSELDKHNPDPAKRSRKMVGVRLLWGLKKSGKGWAGKLYNPHDGKTYTGKVAVSGDSLKLSGCVLGGLFCRSQTWRRAR